MACSMTSRKIAVLLQRKAPMVQLIRGFVGRDKTWAPREFHQRGATGDRRVEPQQPRSNGPPLLGS